MRTVAVCDLGTFSALFLIARRSKSRWHTLLDRPHTIDALRGSFRSGRIAESAIGRMVGAVREFQTRAEEASSESAVVVCTAAIRGATNRREIVRRLRNATRYKVTVLSPRREALYSFSGARIGLRDSERSLIMVDMGGGSTEVVRESLGRLSVSSVRCGAATAAAEWRRRQPHYRGSRAGFFASNAQEIIRVLPRPPSSESYRVVGAGGTIVTLATIAAGLEQFDSARLHGRVVKRSRLSKMASQFSLMSTSDISRLIPFDPERARVLTAGTFLWCAVLDRYGADRVTVSVRGLRWGVAAQLAAGQDL